MANLRMLDVRDEVQKANKKKLKGKKHLRPTAVAVPWQPHAEGDRVWFVLSRKGSWFLPKGGFEEEDNDDVVLAALREKREETCINGARYKQPRYIGSRRNLQRSRVQDHELQTGKHLHFVEVRFHKSAHVHASIGDGVQGVVCVTNWHDFKALPMVKARRKSALLALRKVGISWVKKR